MICLHRGYRRAGRMDAGARKTGDDEGPPATLEIYKAMRAHELMLNQATAAFEHASLNPLLVLNGGAAVAFLTLLGAMAKSATPPDVDGILAAGAVGLWVLGLLCAQVAISAGYRAQQKFAKSLRITRDRVEQHLSRHDEPLARILRRSAPEEDPERLATEARHHQQSLGRARWTSVVLFVGGTVLAAVSVFTAWE